MTQKKIHLLKFNPTLQKNPESTASYAANKSENDRLLPLQRVHWRGENCHKGSAAFPSLWCELTGPNTLLLCYGYLPFNNPTLRQQKGFVPQKKSPKTGTLDLGYSKDLFKELPFRNMLKTAYYWCAVKNKLQNVKKNVWNASNKQSFRLHTKSSFVLKDQLPTRIH